MKIDVAARPTLSVVTWLRRYTTELIVVVLVLLATFGVGMAQALYSNAVPQTIGSGIRITANVVLDQHERHTDAR
jgi:hypothetical protein